MKVLVAPKWIPVETTWTSFLLAVIRHNSLLERMFNVKAAKKVISTCAPIKKM